MPKKDQNKRYTKTTINNPEKTNNLEKWSTNKWTSSTKITILVVLSIITILLIVLLVFLLTWKS